MDLKTARANVKLAAIAFEAAVKAEFPVGIEVNYRRGSHDAWQRAEVIAHGYSGDVRLRIVGTGRIVWVRGANEEYISL